MFNIFKKKEKTEQHDWRTGYVEMLNGMTKQEIQEEIDRLYQRKGQIHNEMDYHNECKAGLVDRKRKYGSTEIGHYTYKGHKRNGDMGGYKLNSVKEMIVIAKQIKKQK